MDQAAGATGAVETEDRSPEELEAEGTQEAEAAAEALRRAETPPGASTSPPAPAAAPEEPEPQVGTSPLQRLAAEERPDVIVVEDDYAEARERAADGRAATEEDWDAVTEWLLSDTSDVITRKLRLRVGGSDDAPQILPWIIRAVGIDTIRSAEREAAGTRRGRQAPEYDELAANLRIITEGTVKPDVKQTAKEKGLADATILIKRRFAYRPGLIAQIAGEVMALSGFDQNDVRAAGNS